MLVPLSVVLVLAIVVVFWWSVSSGQFDDLERHGRSVVDDDDTPDSSALGRPSDTSPVGIAPTDTSPPAPTRSPPSHRSQPP